MKNLKATTAWIFKKYQKKINVNISFSVENMFIDIKQMCGVKVSPQKAYRAKRNILELIGGGDHI